MALKKEIKSYNGVNLKYHRIVGINKIINQCVILEIASYVNEDGREEEINYYNSTEKNKRMDAFINTTYLNLPYEDEKTIKDYYDYLKTTDKFKDAEDV